MNTTDAILKELQAIRGEVREILNDGVKEALSSSQSRLDVLSDQIKAVLDELGGVLKDEEKKFDQLVAARPLASTALAFVVGFALGITIRKSQ